MTNKVIILEREELGKGVFYKIEHTVRGERAIDKIHEHTLIDLIRREVDVELSEGLHEQTGGLDLSYVEVYNSVDGEEIDILLHEIFIDEYGCDIDFLGKLMKTYIRESYAVKYAKSLNSNMIVFN